MDFTGNLFYAALPRPTVKNIPEHMQSIVFRQYIFTA